MIVLVYPNSMLINELSNLPLVYFDNKKFKKMSGSIINIKHTKKININVLFSEVTRLYNTNLPILRRWRKRDNINETSIALDKDTILKTSIDLINLEISDAIFFTGSPHHIRTLFFDIASEIAGIRRIYFELNQINSELLPLSTYNSIDKLRPMHFKTNLDAVSVKDFTFRIRNKQLNLSEQKLNALHYNLQKNFFYCWTYLIAKEFKFLLFQKAFNTKEYKNITEKLQLLNNQRLFIREYRKYQKTKLENYTKKLSVLVFAHFQPEASTFPLGGPYYNHINMINHLKIIGFDNIYYKEHPETFYYLEKGIGLRQVGLFRNKDYINYLISNNIKIYDSSEHMANNSTLDKKNFVVATIVGTVAIERSLSGYKTIIFGKPWFFGLPGTIHIDDVKSIEELKYFNKFDFKILKESKIFIENLLSGKTFGYPFGLDGNPDNQENYFKNLKVLIKKIDDENK